MRRYLHNQESGFSLIELVIALAVGLIVSGIVIGASVNTLRDIRAVKAAERLHANTVFFIDSVNPLVKQATEMSLVSGNPEKLEFTFSDLSHTIIEKSGDTILLNGTPMLSSDILVQSLIFTDMPRSVKISASLQERRSGKIFMFSTTIAQRNTF